MSVTLNSEAEHNAKPSESLSIFKGLNILHIKHNVAEILKHIGQNGIFDEYTKHDVSHIDAMLDSLQWIIPDETKKIMTPVEWLMIVLSIYLHDMGMLVTKSEFNNRHDPNSGFSDYCVSTLFSGSNGLDYRSKIDKLPDETRDRYLYQEFVRSKHAERIKAWITGEEIYRLGISREITSMLDELLQPFDKLFRRDLALICESHNYDDINDTKKYKLLKCYGQKDSESVNLQYCAIILRTADLLHITSDRAPSIQFHIINPTDPISQQEWAKQRAVRRVSPQASCNKDGIPDEFLPKDTIAVHAHFENEDGFFGLTSYLNYANKQILKSNEWALYSKKHNNAKHAFPWRRIDDSHIETEGFIKDTFEFKIDQAKILDLLTGHTLYNDTNVVLRELVQNSIDAIRLQFVDSNPLAEGLINIHWDSRQRTLSVKDNGTGMSQAIIDNFLLKVGSSRYHDPEFIKKHPEFNSISRFGIGVLSSFMIADEVDIITCHPEEEKARRLILRSVHGKYLIRLLEKGTPDALEIGDHGTIFSLHIRQSIDMDNILNIAKYWIIKPNCKVEFTTNTGERHSIGHSTLSNSLRETLNLHNFKYHEHDLPDKDSLKVKFIETEVNGVNLAYALTYNSYFNEWMFLKPTVVERVKETNLGKSLGLCVEGIRVAEESPGFKASPIIAIANVCGPSSPKTNVARSDLEMTPELNKTLLVIYSLYAKHVSDEINELTTHRYHSITRATAEAIFLIEPLLENPWHSSPLLHLLHGKESATGHILNAELFFKALSSIPYILVEHNGIREAKSLDSISELDFFWTIESPFLNSVELLLNQLPKSISLTSLIKNLEIDGFNLPTAPIIRGLHQKTRLTQRVFEYREIETIIVDDDNKQISLRWVKTSNDKKWIDIDPLVSKLVHHMTQERRQYSDRPTIISLKIPVRPIEVTSPTDIDFFRSNDSLYLMPSTDLANYIKIIFLDLDKAEVEQKSLKAAFVLSTINDLIFGNLRSPSDTNELERRLSLFRNEILGNFSLTSSSFAIDLVELNRILNNVNQHVYDINLWTRRTANKN